MACAVDLAFDHQQAQLATKGTGELVKLRAAERGLRCGVIAIGSETIDGRRLAVSGRPLAIPRRLAPIRAPLIGGRLRLIAIGRGLPPVRYSPLAIIGGLQPIPAAPISLCHRLVPIRRIVLGISLRQVLHRLPVGHSLELVAMRRIVVAVGCRVLTIVRGSAAVRRALIGFGLGAIAISRGRFPLLGCELSAKGRLDPPPSALLTLRVRFVRLTRRVMFRRRHRGRPWPSNGGLSPHPHYSYFRRFIRVSTLITRN
jgi:hypothetical protein